VFQGAGFPDFRFRFIAEPPPLEYVVQYQESNFAFVSRMLEEHGFYYTFEHTAAKHTMVISDSVGNLIPAGLQPTLDFKQNRGIIPGLPSIPGLPNVPGVPNIPGVTPGSTPGKAGGKLAGAAAGGLVGSLLGPLGTAAGGIVGGLVGDFVEDLLDSIFGDGVTPPPNAVVELVREHAVHTKTMSARDFHLLRVADQGNSASADPGVVGEHFEFLGDLSGTTAAGISAKVTKQWIETAEAGRDLVRGGSTATTLMPGTRVKIRGGPMGAAGVELHITEVAHVVETGDLFSSSGQKMRYVNEFTAIPVATPYRPERVTPRPSVRGTQTALVVGSGDPGQIDVDDNGRVFIQFPWDRGDGKDGKSAHRVHLASFWSGAGFGAIHLPRISQLVLIEFLEGDPDRPIITGRVYSRNHAHPYTLPANKTQSGIKSRSVGGTADNFNELRFEDKKGEEHVFLQAEKNLQVNVKADETRTVGHSRSATMQASDTHLVVGGDGDKKGQQVLRVQKGDQKMIVEEGLQVLQDQKGQQIISVLEGDQQIGINKGNQLIRVKEGNQKIEVPAGNQTNKVSGTSATSADKITLEADTKIELQVGGAKITMEFNGIVIKVGQTEISVDSQGVIVKGPQVEINGQATTKVTGAVLDLKGSAMTKIAGPMVQATGDAMLKLGGGITMAG
jgi:uncharacterized protein involved in type VI secretion and phage assembly